MAKRKNNTASEGGTATLEKRGFTFTNDLVGEPIKTKEVGFAPRQTSTRYAAVVNKLLGMKKGETLLITVPEDSTLKKFKATMSMTLRKRTAEPLKARDLKLSFGTSDEGKLAVSIVEA